ncbi:HK97 family phage prohead protease [Bosea minatitlanensis]|uniref:HK97 family phage prohead protease n=1 Tax=Bosea minatitlanensis TaxID=128782 RepID=A0ABW0EZV7_9HYPH|nr:HK97 family phage prohead protease [Bosea minatitlanensis]MCT4492720.1 HK97 family phage prohead protease [Bosea minatitlanensis]
MADDIVSVDEFLAERKAFVKTVEGRSGDVLMKASRSAPSSWDASARTIRFVMSAEVEDRDKDIISQAGLAIDEFMKNPVAPFAHRSYDFPIGTWSDVEKVLGGRPKRTEGTLKLVPEGDDVADRLAVHLSAGTIRACSIGFIPKLIKRREKPQEADEWKWPGYEIIEAELVECSPCAIPSNPAALAKSAAKGDVMARELIEEVLDTWAKHPETGLLIPRSEFEAAAKEASGNKLSLVVNAKVNTKGFDTLQAAAEKVGAALAEFETAKGALGVEVETEAVDEPDIKPEAKSLLQRAFGLLFGSEKATGDIEQENLEVTIPSLTKALAAKRHDEIEARLKEKGLI